MNVPEVKLMTIINQYIILDDLFLSQELIAQLNIIFRLTTYRCIAPNTPERNAQ